MAKEYNIEPSESDSFLDPKEGYFKFEVVKRTHQFIIKIYKVTRDFPPEEKYGLVKQLRTAAVSINLNTIEGKYRKSDKEFLRFLQIARGSCAEVHYALRLSKDLNLIAVDKYNHLIAECTQIWKMLNGLIKAVR